MKRKYKDTIILIGAILVLAVYFLGVRGEEFIKLLMALSLIGVMTWIVYYSLNSGYKDARGFIEFNRLKRHKQSTAEIDTMSWKEFEMFVGKWLKMNGFTDVELTEYYDLGVDITARKNNQTWGVQVKHYSNIVGIDAVRQVVGALKQYKCDRAMVVTNSYFSLPAKRLAKSNNCVLIDGSALRKKSVKL